MPNNGSTVSVTGTRRSVVRAVFVLDHQAFDNNNDNGCSGTTI